MFLLIVIDFYQKQYCVTKYKISNTKLKMYNGSKISIIILTNNLICKQSTYLHISIVQKSFSSMCVLFNIQYYCLLNLQYFILNYYFVVQNILKIKTLF